MRSTGWGKRESVGFCTKMSVTVLFAAGGFVGYSFFHLELIASLSESDCYYLPGIEIQVAGFSI